jgi:phosphoserine phosphatase RsbU/P
MSQLLSSPARSGPPEPYEIVACVHSELVKQLINLESFVTLCYARFDLDQQRAYIVDCGHTRTVRYRPRLGVCDLLQGVNLPLGFIEQENYEQVSFELEPDDFFIFYSDGLTETTNAAGDPFGEERLVELVARHSQLDPEQLVAEIHRTVIAFAGSETLSDDLTCVAVKVLEASHCRPARKILVEFLSGLDNLEACRGFVRKICHEIASPAVDEDSTCQLELAVSEAVANVMRHAYDGRPDQPIELSAEVFTDRLAFQIRYRGTSFDPAVVPEPVFDGSKDGGFGLFIIAQSVDEVSYTSDEQGGNCISLVKRIK